MTPCDPAGRHRAAAAPIRARVGIVTVSDTRTAADDHAGALLRGRLEAAGHTVARAVIVPDEPAAIAPLVAQWCAAGDLEAVILTGGSGLSRRDQTCDVVAALLDKTLPGFGELFRMLSYEQVGAAAMLSRAVAGVVAATLVFSLPGSPAACELAMDRLIVPELRHLVWELRR
jgi:molybdenum cofactor biosynthesis protein B